MHYYYKSSTDSVISSSKRNPNLGEYLGHSSDFDANTRRWPRVVNGVMVLDPAAKATWESNQAPKLRASLKRDVHLYMLSLIGTASVTHGGHQYSLQKYDEVLGLAAAASRGIAPANGLKLTDVLGARVSIDTVALDAIGQLMLDYLDTRNGEEAAHVVALDSCSYAQLESYDVTSNWSANP